MTTTTEPAIDVQALLRRVQYLEEQAQQRAAQPAPNPNAAYDSIAALAEADYRQMAPQTDTVPRSAPVGYLERADPHQTKRLKLEQRARLQGGVRPTDPRLPSIYEGRWTPEQEKREMLALGLPIAGEAPPPLDTPEAKGSQRANEPKRTDAEKRLGGRRIAS